jgi:hypothetical protein
MPSAQHEACQLSLDFAAISGAAVETLDAIALKGVGAKQEIFAPVR